MTRWRAIYLALKLAAPHWSHPQETTDALLAIEQRYGVSAELLIADVEHESRWQEDIINPVSGTVGLMQIQPLNIRACSESGDKWTAACWEVRRSLTDWRLNLQVGASYFAFARVYCVTHGHGALARDWLGLPTGWDAVRGSRCGYRDGHRLSTPSGIAWLLRRMASLRNVGRDRPVLEAALPARRKAHRRKARPATR